MEGRVVIMWPEDVTIPFAEDAMVEHKFMITSPTELVIRSDANLTVQVNPIVGENVTDNQPGDASEIAKSDYRVSPGVAYDAGDGWVRFTLKILHDTKLPNDAVYGAVWGRFAEDGSLLEWTVCPKHIGVDERFAKAEGMSLIPLRTQGQVSPV